MPKRIDPRNAPFDLGDFIIAPEAAELLSFAEVRQLLERHARGDWGSVPAARRAQNESFVHPKNRTPGSNAESLHVLRHVPIRILTRQGTRRRQTRLTVASP